MTPRITETPFRNTTYEMRISGLPCVQVNRCSPQKVENPGASRSLKIKNQKQLLPRVMTLIRTNAREYTRNLHRPPKKTRGKNRPWSQCSTFHSLTAITRKAQGAYHNIAPIATIQRKRDSEVVSSQFAL